MEMAGPICRREGPNLQENGGLLTPGFLREYYAKRAPAPLPAPAAPVEAERGRKTEERPSRTEILKQTCGAENHNYEENPQGFQGEIVSMAL